jgi:hypothetical protein
MQLSTGYEVQMEILVSTTFAPKCFWSEVLEMLLLEEPFDPKAFLLLTRFCSIYAMMCDAMHLSMQKI